MILPEVYQSPDGSGLAVETSDGEFIELGRNALGSWDKQGMIEVIPDSWARLASLPDSETEWGIRPIGQDEVEETGAEEWARAVSARMPTLYVVVSRRPAGPWIEVTS